MKTKSVVIAAVSLIWIAALVGAVLLTRHYNDLPQNISQHETILLGQNRFIPGSQSSLRILVRDSRDASPQEDAEVTLSLQAEDGSKPISLYSGRTDASGSVGADFNIPAGLSGKYNLVVETKSHLGSDRFEQPVNLERQYRVLLTSDKPLYQPGQVIHLRALALSTFDRLAASGQEIEITIADGKGNKVLRQKLETSPYGTAAVDFQLASEVNTGDYKVTAVLGGASTEKTVSVEHYVLPKFDANLNADRAYYRPGETVHVDLQADYFFGKPVSNSIVHVEGYTFDFERQVTFTLDGETAEDGSFAFDFALPAFMTGSDLEGGLGRYYLQAAVTDQANHTETASLSLPVAQASLVIRAVPESGRIRQGLENILYVMVSYPDGSPAEAQLIVRLMDTGQEIQAETGPYGVAEISFTPASTWQGVQVQAEDLQGAFSSRDFSFEGDWMEESVILRPDKPLYRVGETMNLAIFTSQQEGTAYLDIVRDGQTLSTRTVAVHAGRGEAAVDLDESLYGTLELHAYKILTSGSIARDTRLAVVDAADELNLAVTFDHPVYRPGDTAGVDFQVDGSGVGVQSALGVAVVDEAVFALAEQDPGFARLYFLLEQELLQPKYDLHGLSLPDMIGQGPVDDTVLVRSQQGAAQAALAESLTSASGFSLSANSHQAALNRAYQAQEQFFKGWGRALFGGMFAASLAAAVVAVIALRRARRLGSSLLIVFAFLYILVLVFALIPLGEGSEWVRTPMDRLSFMVNRFVGSGEILAALIGLAGITGLLAWLIASIIKRDTSLAGLAGLLVTFTAAFILFLFSASRGWTGLPTPAAILLPLSLGLISAAVLARAAGYALQKAPVRAAAGFALTISLVAAIGLLLGGSYNRINGMGMLDGGMMVEEVRAGFQVDKEGLALPAMAPMPTPTAAAGAQVEDASTSTGGQASAPRLRQYFPETMYWLPEAVTGPSGDLHIDLPVADSITTWRLTALASSADGRLGSVQVPLQVFQDFFIDLDLPVSLTVGDEISIPVGIYNYLHDEQSIRLEIEPDAWFELLDPAVQELVIAGNDVGVAYFKVRVLAFGRQAVQVSATGSQMSDAVRKEVQVYPNGKLIQSAVSDRIQPGQPISQTVMIPADAVPGTQKVVVKIYPGVLSQVVEGLDSILRMPSGCFEQTSSTTYPNVLVLDYLRSTAQAAPEAEMKAEEYINLGYQRLTTFEVDGGGFSLFGEAPADRMLSAYGLQEFADMARVADIDRGLLDRTAAWLFAQQNADGTWDNDRGLVHENTWSSLGDDRLPVTAYIAWSLIDAGFYDEPGTQKALEYLVEFQSKAEDPYVTALLANALVAADRYSGSGETSPAAQAVLDRLASMVVQEGSGAVWPSQIATFMGSEGQVGSIETTALAAYAFLRSGTHPDLANAALVSLIQRKDSYGTWYSTQATVLTLKALLQSVKAGGENVDVQVNVTLNGGQEKQFSVGAGNFDVVQMVAFEDMTPGRENMVQIVSSGTGSLMYQVTTQYYLPWSVLSLYPDLEQPELVEINVDYDRTELAVNDLVTVNVRVSLAEGIAESAMIDLGIPPGFSVQADDLQALVNRFNDTASDYAGTTLDRFELTGRQALIYLRNLQAGLPFEFSYRLQARFPLTAQAPASLAYDYYNPGVSGLSQPQVLVVRQAE